MPNQPTAALCEAANCEWSRTAENEDVARLLSVLHILLKHPDKYKEITGKDPEYWAYQYREAIKAYQKEL